MLTHLDLFSGIGGFALGFRNAGGIRTVAFCEIDSYAQKVLAKNFPNVHVLEWCKAGLRRLRKNKYAFTNNGGACNA